MKPHLYINSISVISLHAVRALQRYNSSSYREHKYPMVRPCYEFYDGVCWQRCRDWRLATFSTFDNATKDSCLVNGRSDAVRGGVIESDQYIIEMLTIGTRCPAR